MNADAEFIKLLKDEADKWCNVANRTPSEHHAMCCEERMQECLHLLKRLGITYTPNSRKDRE